MAGTVVQDSLVVTTNESISLNGQSYGNNMTDTITGQGKIIQTITTIASKGNESDNNYTDIVSLGASDGAGAIKVSELKYLRITNTDDAEDLVLRLQDGTDHFMFVKVKAGKSFVLQNFEFDVLTSAGDPTFVTMDTIKGYSDSASAGLDIELLAVRSGGIAG